VGGIMMFTELVTEKKNNQEMLIKAKEAAEQAALTKSRFLSVMSHEIRTPMNGVIGFTNLLLLNAREDQREYLNMLKFSADNLMVIINDILDLNKIDAGMVVFEQLSFSLHELMSNIYKAQLPSAKEKGLQLRFYFDPALPGLIIGDPVRIGQVIITLISNAIKFTATGEVKINVTLLSEKDEKALINFSITDTGIGIPEDKHDYIFEIFSQASTETTRKYGGTGLGLAITKRLLELMGSDIYLKSTPGFGSEFYFSLEFKEGVLQTEPDDYCSEDIKNLKGVKILITEDNAINVMVVQRFLQRWQAEYDVAENGQIAVDKVKENTTWC
jgi:signal transduction histidine kinase